MTASERAMQVARGIVDEARQRNDDFSMMWVDAELLIATALDQFQGEWSFDMEAAPKDGTEIEALCVHRNFLYAKNEDLSDWVAIVRAHWIDHNSGGWTWHGLAGRFIAWRLLPAAPKPEER